MGQTVVCLFLGMIHFVSIETAYSVVIIITTFTGEKTEREFEVR